MDSMSDAEFDAKVGFPVGERYVPKSKLDAAEARATAAERERDALREALRPFAMVAEHDIDNSEHDNDLYVGNGGRYNRAPSLHVRHFRAALTANHSAPVVEE